MIDKLFGRDNTEQEPVEPVEEPAEVIVEPVVNPTAGLSLAIKGLWSGAAHELNPKAEIEVKAGEDKLFYMIESSGKGFGEQRHMTSVLMNGRLVVSENGTIKEGDSTDTGVIPVPGNLSVPGQVVKVIIQLRTWEGQDLYQSPAFTVKFV